MSFDQLQEPTATKTATTVLRDECAELAGSNAQDGDLPLFRGPRTLAQAQAERDDALERVEASADPDWKTDALEALRRTALRLPEFISDDVWQSGLPSTREDRALGPIFMAAARACWIVKTDRVRPSRRSHGSGKPVWRSLIFRGVP